MYIRRTRLLGTFKGFVTYLQGDIMETVMLDTTETDQKRPIRVQPVKQALKIVASQTMRVNVVQAIPTEASTEALTEILLTAYEQAVIASMRAAQDLLEVKEKWKVCSKNERTFMLTHYHKAGHVWERIVYHREDLDKLPATWHVIECPERLKRIVWKVML